MECSSGAAGQTAPADESCQVSSIHRLGKFCVPDVVWWLNPIAGGSKGIKSGWICAQSEVAAGKLPTDGDEETFESLWDERHQSFKGQADDNGKYQDFRFLQKSQWTALDGFFFYYLSWFF